MEFFFYLKRPDWCSWIWHFKLADSCWLPERIEIEKSLFLNEETDFEAIKVQLLRRHHHRSFLSFHSIAAIHLSLISLQCSKSLQTYNDTQEAIARVDRFFAKQQCKWLIYVRLKSPIKSVSLLYSAKPSQANLRRLLGAARRWPQTGSCIQTSWLLPKLLLARWKARPTIVL